MATTKLTDLRSAVRTTVRFRWPGALGPTICVGLPLGVGVAVGHSDWGAFAALGGLAGFYGLNAGYAARLRLVLVVGVVLTIVVPVSGLAGSHAWSAALVVCGVAAISTFVCRALAVAPPRELLIILAALVSTGVPRNLPGTVGLAAQVGAGALLALAIIAVWALAGRGQAERAPSRAAWTALQALVDAAATPGVVRCRREAVAAVRAARLTVVAGAGGVERSVAAAEVLLPAALSASIVAVVPLPPRLSEAIADLGRGENPGVERCSPTAAAERTLAAGATAAWSVLDGASAIVEPSPRGPGLGARLRLAGAGESVVVPVAARVAVAVGLGVAIGRVLGLEHSYWVALTAAAALQADSFTGLARRSSKRLVGTCAGVVASAAIFALHPVPAVVVVVAIVALWLAEIAIADNYAVAVTFMSILALSVYELAAHGTATGTALDARLLDTAIGVGLVVVVRLVLWPRATASRAPQRAAAVLRAAAATFTAGWSRGPSDAEPERWRLEEQLLPFLAITQELRGEPGALGARQAQAAEGVEQLAMLALAVPPGREPPPAPDAAALTTRLQQLADTLTSEAPANVEQEPVRVRTYPRTSAALALLQAALIGTPGRPIRKGPSTAL
jgi:hypothetical protein